MPSNSTMPTLLPSRYHEGASSVAQLFGSLTSFEGLSTYDSAAALAVYLVGTGLEAAGLAAGLAAGVGGAMLGLEVRMGVWVRVWVRERERDWGSGRGWR